MEQYNKAIRKHILKHYVWAHDLFDVKLEGEKGEKHLFEAFLI